MTNPPEVVLVDGDEASGMACMLADLITENLSDYPGRSMVARRARGDVAFTTTDQGISVTLSFRDGRVEITDGARPGAPIVASPWLVMAALCSGRASPLKARSEGDLSVTFNRRPLTVAAAAYVVSVPPTHYGDGSRRRVAIYSGIAVSLAALTIAWRLRSRRPAVAQVGKVRTLASVSRNDNRQPSPMEQMWVSSLTNP